MTDAVSPYAYVGNSPVNFVDPFGWAAQGATITTQSAYASATATDWTTPVGGGQTGEQYVQAQMLLRTVPAPPTGPNPGYQGITVPGGTGTRVNPLTDMPVTTPPSLADQIAKGIHDALIRPILDGANALGNFILEQIGANSGDKPTAPGDVLAPNGQPVGDMAGGAGPGVRTVTPGQLDGIIDGLKGLGAKPGSNCNYPGDWYDLPNNQDEFGIRDSRGSGRTVDVNIPGVPDVTKIHQKP